MRKYRFELLLVTCYLLLAAIFTYPLIFKLGSSVYSAPDRTIDVFSTIYDWWWQKEAAHRGLSPDFFEWLGVSGYGFGERLPMMFLANGFSNLLTKLFNEVLAYNVLTLLSFPLAGLAMYFLAFYLTGNRWASSLAGLFFAFSPLHFQYALEWVGMVQWHWLPLYVLSLLKFDEKKSVRWGLLTGLLFAVVFMENYYFGYFIIFFTLAFFLFRVIQLWLKERGFYLDRTRFYSLLTALATALVLTLPATQLFVRESAHLAAGEGAKTSGFVQEEWPRFAFSAKPWFYLFPDVNHPVFGHSVQKFYNWLATKPPYFLTKPFYPREHTLYLGWTTLILSAFAALRPTRRIWLFLFLAIVMMIFSAPPYVTISLHKIYFPSYFLGKYFSMFTAYARFGVLVLLCVSVLAAFGLAFLFEKVRSRRSFPILYSLFFILVSFEFLNFPPFHSISTEPLPIYEWLAEQPGDFAILVYPPDSTNYDLLMQRIHKKRFLNPRRRTAAEVLEVVEDLNTPEAKAKLCEWDARYLIVKGTTDDKFYENSGYLNFEDLLSRFNSAGNYSLLKVYDHPPVYLFEIACL